MNATTWIKGVFRKLTPAEVASTSLAEAEMSRLEALASQEYATALVGLQDARIKRLKAFLKQQGDAV